MSARRRDGKYERGDESGVWNSGYQPFANQPDEQDATTLAGTQQQRQDSYNAITELDHKIARKNLHNKGWKVQYGQAVKEWMPILYMLSGLVLTKNLDTSLLEKMTSDQNIIKWLARFFPAIFQAVGAPVAAGIETGIRYCAKRPKEILPGIRLGYSEWSGTEYTVEFLLLYALQQTLAALYAYTNTDAEQYGYRNPFIYVAAPIVLTNLKKLLSWLYTNCCNQKRVENQNGYVPADGDTDLETVLQNGFAILTSQQMAQLRARKINQVIPYHNQRALDFSLQQSRGWQVAQILARQLFFNLVIAGIVNSGVNNLYPVIEKVIEWMSSDPEIRDRIIQFAPLIFTGIGTVFFTMIEIPARFCTRKFLEIDGVHFPEFNLHLNRTEFTSVVLTTYGVRQLMSILSVSQSDNPAVKFITGDSMLGANPLVHIVLPAAGYLVGVGLSKLPCCKSKHGQGMPSAHEIAIGSPPSSPSETKSCRDKISNCWQSTITWCGSLRDRTPKSKAGRLMDAYEEGKPDSLELGESRTDQGNNGTYTAPQPQFPAS